MPVNVNGVAVTLAGGVRETTQTTGTGTYSLDGAATVEGITYRTFVAGVGSGVTTVYTARLGSQFETGIGVVTSGAPATITRAAILESSNSNNAVNWGVGVKDIILDAPAAVFHSLQAAIDGASYVNRAKTTVITGSGTFTTDGDCLYAHVRIVGGGGAGGGSPATAGGQAAEGGGGGGGEYAEGWFTAAQLGASQSVTIGTGGTGVSGDDGNNGSTTSVGSLLTAAGGSGGTAGLAGTDFFAAGGAGGTGGSGGTFRVQGHDGRSGIVRGGARFAVASGGASLLGSSRDILGDASTGKAGRNYGSGGTGASNGAGASAFAGGAGAPGVCIVVEFCKV
jgi:hypothetical protein